MFDLFTLIIPTYNRPKFLHRLLSHLEKEHCDFRVIVVDSSDKGYLDSNESIVKNFKQVLNVQLVHAQESHAKPSDYSLNKKIILGLSYVETKYVALCADDDFVSPIGIAECVKFLESNKGFSCARGSIIDYKIVDHDRVIFAPVSNIDSLVSDNVEDRLYSVCRRYQHSYYAVFKTEERLLMEKLISNGGLGNNQGWLYELAVTALASVFGYIGRFSFPYEYREQHQNNLGASAVKWPDLIFDESQRPMIDAYINIISDAIVSATTSIEKKDAAAVVKKSLIGFSKYYFDTRFRDRQYNARIGRWKCYRSLDGVAGLLRRLSTVFSYICLYYHHFRVLILPETKRVRLLVKSNCRSSK